MTELAGIESPEEQERITQVRVARWKALRPPDTAHPNMIGYSAARAEVIKDLRDLADFLEARPEMPVSMHTTVTLCAFTDGTDEQKRAQVDYASTLLAAPVTDRTSQGGHYVTGVRFGSARYEVVAISKEPEEPVPATASRVTASARVSRRTSQQSSRRRR